MTGSSLAAIRRHISRSYKNTFRPGSLLTISIVFKILLTPFQPSVNNSTNCHQEEYQQIVQKHVQTRQFTKCSHRFQNFAHALRAFGQQQLNKQSAQPTNQPTKTVSSVFTLQAEIVTNFSSVQRFPCQNVHSTNNEFSANFRFAMTICLL